MNNDITVEILRELWRYKTTDKYTEIEIRRALETAIEAVNGLRPHGEMRLIDAGELRKVIHCEYSDDLGILEKIDQAPTIKTFTLADIEAQYRKGLEKGLEERPHGEWVQQPTMEGHTWYECSVCKSWIQDMSCYDYCPNCGAPMTEEAFRKYNGLKEGGEAE